MRRAPPLASFAQPAARAPGSASHPPPTRPKSELYTPENVFIDSGALVLRTRLQNTTWDGISFNVTSGRVDTLGKQNITFGRVEVSAQLQNDAASGIHTAHWLLGYGCWPQTAEVDIMECQSPHNAYYDGGNTTWQQVTSTYHYGVSCGAQTRHSTGSSAWPPTPSANFSAGFNVFAVEWNRTDLVFYVNDARVNHVWDGMPGWEGPLEVPTWPMFLIMSQAYMAKRPRGDPPGWAWPVEQRIDFVRVYGWEP